MSSNVPSIDVNVITQSQSEAKVTNPPPSIQHPEPPPDNQPVMVAKNVSSSLPIQPFMPPTIDFKPTQVPKKSAVMSLPIEVPPMPPLKFTQSMLSVPKSDKPCPKHQSVCVKTLDVPKSSKKRSKLEKRITKQLVPVESVVLVPSHFL